MQRQFQTASQIFHKGHQTLTLQGMIHWGTEEFFTFIQNSINSCTGIILVEDSNHLDPRETVQLTDQEFDALCRRMKRHTNKTLKMMSTLLELRYQWDVLRYPGPPHALAADVSWKESSEFGKYQNAISEKRQPAKSTAEATWDLMIQSGKEGALLLFEVIYQCFRNRGQEQKSGKTKKRLQKLFEQHRKRHGFAYPDTTQQVFMDLVNYYGNGDPDYEPEIKAFVFAKREQRVFALVTKIEKLDYIHELLVLYGSGHFDALQKGLRKAGWQTSSEVIWTTAWTFPECTTREMMRALNAIVNTHIDRKR